jgi:hypothetical protein
LPYPQSDRLVTLWQVERGAQRQVSFPDYADLAATPVFDGAAAMMGGRGSLRIGDRIERVNALDLEPAGFGLLGATPILGRLLTQADVGRPHALISHRLWTTHLGSDPAIVGRLLWLRGRTLTAIGVLAPGFDIELPVTPAFGLREHDLWMPFDRQSAFVGRRDVTAYEAIARLAPGVTLAAARAAVDAAGAWLSVEHATTNARRTFRVTPLLDDIVKDVRRPLRLVGLAAAATFAVGLANLITLTLLRISDRRVELAVREALGAGRGGCAASSCSNTACWRWPAAPLVSPSPGCRSRRSCAPRCRSSRGSMPSASTRRWRPWPPCWWRSCRWSSSFCRCRRQVSTACVGRAATPSATAEASRKHWWPSNCRWPSRCRRAAPCSG